MKTIEEKHLGATQKIRELMKERQRLYRKLNAAEHLIKVKSEQLQKEQAKLESNMRFIAYWLHSEQKEIEIPYMELLDSKPEQVKMMYDKDKNIIHAKYDDNYSSTMPS